MNWLKLSLQALLYPIKVVLNDIVYIYKWIISPCLPHTCRFYPTCSTYMLLSIREWGIVRGLWLGINRIFRCRPKGKSGYDFVPQNIKGELRWIY